MRDVCNSDAVHYQHKDFQTSALQHTKLQITWDQDDQDRIKVTKRKFTSEDLKDMDFKAYLASDSESEGELKEKYKSLFEKDESEEEQDGAMEITFTPGLSNSLSDAVQRRKANDFQDETVFEKELRLRKEKRKAKKHIKDDDNSESIL